MTLFNFTSFNVNVFGILRDNPQKIHLNLLFQPIRSLLFNPNEKLVLVLFIQLFCQFLINISTHKTYYENHFYIYVYEISMIQVRKRTLLCYKKSNFYDH